MDREEPILAPNVHAVPYQALRDAGVCALGFDVDNALVKMNAKRVGHKEQKLFVKTIDLGFVNVLTTNSARNLNGITTYSRGPAVQAPGYIRRLLLRSARHMSKPNEGFFRRVEEVTLLTSDQHVLIDDKFKNVLAAISFGWWGVWVPPLGPDLWTERLNGMREKDYQRMRDRGFDPTPYLG